MASHFKIFCTNFPFCSAKSENISLNLLYLLFKDGTLGDFSYYNMVQVVLFCNNFSQIEKADIFLVLYSAHIEDAYGMQGLHSLEVHSCFPITCRSMHICV